MSGAETRNLGLSMGPQFRVFLLNTALNARVDRPIGCAPLVGCCGALAPGVSRRTRAGPGPTEAVACPESYSVFDKVCKRTRPSTSAAAFLSTAPGQRS